MRALRQQRGLTLRDVGRDSGLSISHLSEIERGVTNLSLGGLEQLAAALGVDPLLLLGGDSTQYERRMRAEGRLERIRTILDED